MFGGGGFNKHCPFMMLFYGAHFSFYYQHGWHVEGVTIIESFLGTKHGNLLGGPLFVWPIIKLS